MDLDHLREQLRYAYDPHYRRFHELMGKRVKKILMASNQYESFSLSRDGSITGDIYGTYQLLHLQNVPQITSVLSAREALRFLEEEQFDLVLASANLPDMEISGFGREVKARHPGLPVVMLVFEERWLDTTYGGSEPGHVDWVFAWRGSAHVLLSIIKLSEDSFNVDRDLQLASIGIIIVIEDSIERYSTILPLLYATLMQQTFSLVPEGINENDRQVRTRVRPKVLLARTFPEAEALFDRYENSLVGIISDLRTHLDDRINPLAGQRFLEKVVSSSPGTPILIQSAEPDAEELADRLGVRWVDKKSGNTEKAIKDFILGDVGFGDFVFRSPGAENLERASNLWELERALSRIPEESIVFHAERNDFSHWLRARGETTLAEVLRPLSSKDFSSTRALREFMISAIAIARQEKYRGAIADFRGREFDPGYPFLVMGRGSLGGKGRGLAFMFNLMGRQLREDRIEGIRVCFPSTLVVATDEFERFLAKHQIRRRDLMGLDDLAIRRRFSEQPLTEGVRKDLKRYVERVHSPLAVRSSSLLEDSHHQPSAGLYATYMLPNNHPRASVRLDQLCGAIQLVYASAFLERPRRYHQSIGLTPAEEKMAVIVQEVVGRAHGHIYYPTFSGVAQSHNYYPIFDMKPEDGVATVALGLGKQVVEGGDAVRFCPRYPQVIPQFGSPASVLKVSQRDFFALDLSRSQADLVQGTDSTLVKLPLSRAEEDGSLHWVGSVVCAADNRVYDGINRPGARVVTFAHVLKSNVFPLAAILERLLEIGRENVGFPLELEFAVNLEGGEPVFYFLQLRPLVARRERGDISLEAIPPHKMICRSHRVLGNGKVDDLRDILYIHPGRYDRARSREVAARVSEINDRLMGENRRYILMGPGRWGSLDPWIGIPVVWHQISQAKIIVELPARDMPLDPSQGTHFFHNLISAGIGYFSLASSNEKEFVRWEILESLPGEQVTPWLRHVRLDQPLTVHMDGQTQKGVICLV